MDKFIKVVGWSVLAASFLFIAPMLGTLFGALGASIVGLFFGDTIISFLGRLGVNTEGISMWQIGAGLGFLGGFIRSSSSSKSSKD